MIVVERKPIEQIKEFVWPYKRILIVGCGECATVCFAGGEKEVGTLASQLRILWNKQDKEIKIIEQTIQRQCEKKFVNELKENIEKVDAILSLGCGAGVQYITEIFPKVAVYPGVDTKFLGGTGEPGLWIENCQACGDCLLDKTGGICPIACCSKSLLNGPCGGSQNGKCEVSEEIDCAWEKIIDQMKILGRLKELDNIQPIKDWSKSRDGGSRKVIREDLKLE